ncbi:MAG TPA: D-aminoacyl-tRNA deacylase [Clostridia bacterium]|jgi:D-tyrosyl-tRNA(Tyr) deacylase|nr:D-aminoacyl-tRNA deacylase [Clostridia bacterium]
MHAVVQRVTKASVIVDGLEVSNINHGLCVYLGVARGDTIDEVIYIAKKIANLRIFENEEGKMSNSVLDVSGEVLLISQFTLLANCNKGNRPDFTNAEKPEVANELYIRVGSELEKLGLKVKYGQFGAHMTIPQVNDGPVTILLSR